MDQLYLVEVLVDKIKFANNVLEIPERDEVIIEVSFENVANLEIQTDALNKIYYTSEIDKYKKDVKINSGKSYLFSSKADALRNAMEESPLKVTLRVLRKPESESDSSIGVAILPWESQFVEMVYASRVNPNGLVPVSSRNVYQLTKDDDLTCEIELFLRLSCFGAGIQTQFQVVQRETKSGNPPPKKYLFKSSNTETTFQAQKFGEIGAASEMLPVGPIYNPSDPKTWNSQEDSSPDVLTNEKLNKILCKNPDCPGVQRFKDFGIGPAATGVGLGTVYGLTDVPISYGLSHTYGNLENYGPYGVFSRPKSLDQPFIPKDIDENVCNNCNYCTDQKSSNPSNQRFCKCGYPLRLTGGAPDDDDVKVTRPMEMCKDLMDSFDKVLHAYKSAIGPCGQATCPYSPTIVEDMCKKCCNNEVPKKTGPKLPSACGSPMCPYGKIKLGAATDEDFYEMQLMQPLNSASACGSPKCPFPMQTDLPPIHWDCPDPLPKGPCRNPRCPFKPKELQFNVVPKGPCGSTECPFAVPPFCGGSACPFGPLKSCPYEHVSSESFSCEPQCESPCCGPCCGPQCPPPSCGNSNCPPKPAKCGDPSCPFKPPSSPGLSQPCKNPGCPAQPPSCRDPNCPLSLQPAPCPAMGGPGQCAPMCNNPGCPSNPLSCGDRDCPLNPKPRPCPGMPPPCAKPVCPPPCKLPPCGDPKCPFSSVCCNPQCPFTTPSCPSSSPCSNPQCPYASPCPPPSPCCNPQCPHVLPCPPPSPCGNPQCPYASPCPPVSPCGDPRCPFVPPCSPPPCPPPPCPPSPCDNPCCPFAKISPCGNTQCPYAELPQVETRDVCCNPECPFQNKEPKDGDSATQGSICSSPYCPFAPQPCEAPECTQGIDKHKSGGGFSPCTLQVGGTKITVDYGMAENQDDIPLEIVEGPEVEMIPDKRKLPSVDFGKRTDRGSIMIGDIEYTSGDRVEVEPPCTPLTCKYKNGGNIICSECGTSIDPCTGMGTGPCDLPSCYAKGGTVVCSICAAKNGAKHVSQSAPTIGQKSKRTPAGGTQSEKIISHTKDVKAGRKKRSKYVYNLGDLYPGVNVGHRECIIPGRNVPAKMGWLWNVHVPCLRLKPRLGWRPGAVGRTIANRIRAHRKAKGLKVLEPLTPKSSRKKVKAKASEYESDSDATVAPKPTLQIKKREGCYYITMNPLKDPKTIEENENPYMDCTPMQFKITKNKDKLDNDSRSCVCGEDDDDEKKGDTSSDSELDIEFTPPAGVIRPERLKRKKNVVHTDTQYCQEDFQPQGAKEKGKGKDKKGKGKKGKKGK